MKKYYLFFVLIAMLQSPVFSQITDDKIEKKVREVAKDSVDGWTKGGIMTLNLAQTALSNWAAGGRNSLALSGLLSLYAKHKKGDRLWENYLDLGYGLLKEGKDDFIKTDDRIDFISKYGKKAAKHWYYSALFNFRTQFTPGYNYPNDSVKISDFFAPAYSLVAVGFDYKPDNYLSIFFAPLTYRATIVNSDYLSSIGAFGVDPGKKLRNEIGGYVRLVYSRKDFKGEFLKNVSFTTKLDLFSNYLVKPQNVDVSWETLISMKVNKILSVNLNTHLIYDDNMRTVEYAPGKFGARTQFKEIFGVGFSAKF